MNPVPLQPISSDRHHKRTEQLGDLKEETNMANTKKIIFGIMLCTVAILATACSDSNPVDVNNVIDTAPPATPYAVRSTVDNTTGAATITWGVNTVDSDLVGYVVSRDNDGDVVQLISTPILTQSVQDASPKMGANTYSVYAVDEAGNQSAVQHVTLTVAGAHQAEELSH